MNQAMAIDTLQATLRTYGLEGHVLPNPTGSPFVLMECNGRRVMFNPLEMPGTLTASVEWLHNIVRNLLPEGWGPVKVQP